MNGLPLELIELNNPADQQADVWKAFDQLQTYQAEISRKASAWTSCLPRQCVVNTVKNEGNDKQTKIAAKTHGGGDDEGSSIPQILMRGSMKNRLG